MERKTDLRETKYLKKRYSAILSSTGIILFLGGIIMLIPLIVLLSNPAESEFAQSFYFPAGILLLSGIFLKFIFRSAYHTSLSLQEGGIIVLLSWIIVIIFSAWPFISVLDLSVSCAVFESVSGWTTTGLSVVDVEKAGQMILLWRSVIQLCGGAGLAVIMMSAIIGYAPAGIPCAEGRSDQLVPHVRRSARLVLIIYSGYAAAGTFFYKMAGMSFFDSVNHAFAAVSTGGFSTKSESIGYWNSLSVEAVTLPLMILGNLSFITAWLLCRKKFLFVLKNGEIRLQSILIPLAAAGIFIFTSQSLYPNFDKSLRVALFETVTALTTTGFSTVSYSNWNSFGIFVLIVLMLIGGGTCSTAGGIKQYRIYLLYKFMVCEVKRYLLPEKAVLQCPVWERNTQVFIDDAKLRQVSFFIFLYLFVYISGVITLCGYGYSIQDSLFEFASAMGTVGLSVGVTSAQMPTGALMAETAAMFLGRLEFIIIIISLIKMGRDINLMIVPFSKRRNNY